MSTLWAIWGAYECGFYNKRKARDELVSWANANYPIADAFMFGVATAMYNHVRNI